MARIDVLDKGYVRYVKHMGDDLDVVNSAKVSFAKESGSFEDRENRLLGFLAREEHTSVFRHSALTYEVYAPLMVARQWWKYVVSSAHLEDQNGWNESSRRYLTEEPTFYVPGVGEWRSAPDNKKQGSGDAVDEKTARWAKHNLEDLIERSCELYDLALEKGICAEQARLLLPAYGMYVRWRWTASLGAVLHFLHQRLEHDAQREIYDFAVAIKNVTADHFPATMRTLS